MTFDGTQKIIGRGAQAEVFLYHGFAYKVYNQTYPVEWIEFEKHQQKEINKARLCPVKYYDTDDSHIIKMDFVSGKTLENTINEFVNANLSNQKNINELSEEERADGMAKMMNFYKYISRAYSLVHSAKIEGLEIPHLRDTAAMRMNNEDSKKVRSIINDLSAKMKNCVCHLDMHFLNIMIPDGSGEKEFARAQNEFTAENSSAAAVNEFSAPQNASGAVVNSSADAENAFTIIDWMNARIAPAVFDYARTYVIFNEFSKDALELFKNIVLSELWTTGISEEDFSSAVEVCKIIRSYEK